MPSDIRTSPNSAASPQGALPREANTPVSGSSHIAALAMGYQQIEAEEQRIVQTIDKLTGLEQELRELNGKLLGNLSSYSRDEVIQLGERAHMIEHQLKVLRSSEQVRTDAPGL